MIKWPSIYIPTFKKTDRNDFDSILPISAASSSRNSKSIFGYIYDASASISTAISGSCQIGLVYVTEVAGSVVNFGKTTTLPQTQQDTFNFIGGKTFNSFDAPQTPMTTPIVATNHQLIDKWTPATQQESMIKTPTHSIFSRK